MSTCTGCGADRSKAGQWWHTAVGYGVSGFWCSDCYEVISLDAYGQPKNPEQRNLMIAQLRLKGQSSYA